MNLNSWFYNFFWCFACKNLTGNYWVLLIIGASIWITQSQFNPAVLQKGAFFPKPTQKETSSQLSSNPHFLPLPEDIQPLTEAEIFDAGNLSDKINGKAELYLSAGFTRISECCSCLGTRPMPSPIGECWGGGINFLEKPFFIKDLALKIRAALDVK